MVTINRGSREREREMTKHMLLCLHHQSEVVRHNCAHTMMSFPTTNIHIQRTHDTPSFLSFPLFSSVHCPSLVLCDACASECYTALFYGLSVEVLTKIEVCVNMCVNMCVRSVLVRIKRNNMQLHWKKKSSFRIF